MNASGVKTQSIGVWKSLPAPVKGIIIVGVLVGGFFLVKKILRNAATNEKVKDAKNELQSLVEQGIKPTLTTIKVQNIVDGLYESMDNWVPRRDTYLEDFKRYFYQIKNSADLMAVMTKFGNKDGYTLTEWIQKEYPSANRPNSDDLIAVSEVANDHLRGQGIKYRF